MLHVTKHGEGSYSARFLLEAQFVPCIGERDEATAQKLTILFRKKTGQT
jgi:protein-L-isoaspartate(D-aspartate) O-methyltransferase